MTNRYLIDIPAAVKGELEKVAQRRNVTMDEVVTSMVKLILTADILEQEGTPLMMVNGDGELAELDVFKKVDTQP